MNTECTIELFKVNDSWTWQIRSAPEVITPMGGRTFRSPVNAKRAAVKAADRMRLNVRDIVNLEEVAK